MRRRPGQLVPLEVEILTAGLALRGAGEETFHGFRLAGVLAAAGGARRLTAHGTLYKALARLEAAGLVVSAWEDAEVAAGEGRPRRRLYEVTGAAERAVARARAEGAPSVRPQPRPGLESS